MKKKIQHFNWDGKIIQLLEIFIDLFIIVSIYILSVVLVSQYSLNELFQGGDVTRDLVITSCALGLGVLIFFRVYKISITKRGYISTMFRLTISLVMVDTILFLLSIVYQDYTLPIVSLGLMLVFQLFSLAITKGIAYLILIKLNVKTSLIFGLRDEVDNLAKKLLYDDNKFVYLKYLVYDEFDNGEIGKLFDYIDTVDYVYLTESLSTDKKNIIIAYCFKMKKRFYLVPKMYELSINHADVSQVGDTLVYEINGLGLTLEQRFVKRVFDLLVSFIALLIAFPFMVLAALAIKLYDRGPILLKQERITRNNKKFTLYKFRTMIPDAEKNTGPVFAASNDNRVTKIGKFLRATRIDELPQLINILIGDMSVVGPRPEREYFIKQFIEENKDYQYRLNVKSGVTGLAQALGTYNTKFNEKLRFDIYYITNYSFLNDIYILLHTIKSIFDPNSAKGLVGDVSLENCLSEEGYYIFDANDIFIKIITKK